MSGTGIFATTEEVQRKVGANASTISNTPIFINDFLSQAESFINVSTGVNWTEIYSTLKPSVREILKECASNLAAIYVLNYDLGEITFNTSRIEAENRINVLWARVNLCIRTLKETGSIGFMRGL